MDKMKVRIVIKVLPKVLAAFPDTQDFIEKNSEEVSSREGVPVDEKISFVVSFHR